MKLYFRLSLSRLGLLLAALSLGQALQAGVLIDINFNALSSPGLTAIKTGMAATGHSANDFWNDYSRDDANGNWRLSGFISPLKTAEGVTTTAGLTVDNANGAWACNAPDPMYNTFVYGLNGGELNLTIFNLPRSTYNLYIYGPDSTYTVSAGALNLGSKTLPAGPYNNPVWTEGLQYALFKNLALGPDSSLWVNVQHGVADGYAKISGLQLVEVPEPGLCGLLLVGGLGLAARRWSRRGGV